MTILKVSEASLKNACETYLNLQQLSGRLIWFRLNSGDVFIPGDDHRKPRRIKLNPIGTSDNLIILPARQRRKGKAASCIFIEYKSSNGKQTREQAEFEKQVISQGHSYWLVSDTDGFIEAINKELEG